MSEASLQAPLNQFGGREIDPASLPTDPVAFREALRRALSEWQADGTKIVWLTLPTSHAAAVPVAVDAGFTYHHADELGVVLTRALVDGAFVPPYATHYIGAGGVVVNDSRELLVVSERYRGKWGHHYKLPGGALHRAEHISNAVRREVLEETGIETEFVSLVCFRHWHGYRYGKSDIYFVCRLRPTSLEIHADPGEIEEAKWMPLNEYLNHPNVHEFNRRIVRAAVEHDGVRRSSIEGYGTEETHELYFP